MSMLSSKTSKRAHPSLAWPAKSNDHQRGHKSDDPSSFLCPLYCSYHTVPVSCSLVLFSEAFRNLGVIHKYAFHAFHAFHTPQLSLFFPLVLHRPRLRKTVSFTARSGGHLYCKSRLLALYKPATPTGLWSLIPLL